MEKELVLLAQSRKYGNYCVAGIDTTTGEWIRLVSEDPAIANAVRQEAMVCQDGGIAKVMDIVRVSCQSRERSFHQSENHVLTPGMRWIRKGQTTLAEVLRLHQPERHAVLFYNRDRRVDRTDIEAVPAERRYSLALIRPSHVMIAVIQWPEKVAPSITACFLYEGKEYSWVSMTDLEVTRLYGAKQPGRYRLPDNAELYFVMSLGEVFVRDGYHYKLVASVLRH